MKTPIEKAFELYEKHLQYTPVEFEQEYAKKACIISLELKIQGMTSINDTPPAKRQQDDFYCQYWNQVINEVNKL